MWDIMGNICEKAQGNLWACVWNICEGPITWKIFEWHVGNIYVGLK